MLLFKKPFHRGLVDGSIRLTFRRWARPHVRAGGRYRCHPIGVLEVDRVEPVRVSSIGEGDARLCGFGSRAELLAFMAEREPIPEDAVVFRVELHHGGDGDRVESALDETLADLQVLRATLARLDASRRWTRKVLKLIDTHPRVAASKLAERLGRETAEFKADVVKLKKLGLTQSFEVGYELSPRGRAYLTVTARRRRA
jgi:hypothetical protein